jgi:hypothetical protein
MSAQPEPENEDDFAGPNREFVGRFIGTWKMLSTESIITTEGKWTENCFRDL